MASYTSLDQAQSSLSAVNSTIEQLESNRSQIIETRGLAWDKLNDLNQQMAGALTTAKENSFFSSEYQSAIAKQHELKNQITLASKELESARLSFNDVNSQITQAQSEKTQIESAISQFETPGSIVTDVTSTNRDNSALETLRKYENADIVGDTDTTNYSNEGRRYSKGIAETNPGAMQSKPADVSVVFKSMAGDQINSDMRVKIRVPDDYLTDLTSGSGLALRQLQGIIFPYTPTISVKHSAEYTDQQPLHSNFSVYFYKRSKVEPITISGKFTVQNDSDAENFIATVHLLRSLTKMRSGGSAGDADSGAPPPVCRLNAYGTFMLQNVPVVISSFSLTLPDNVDYFTYGKTISGKYEKTAVPVVATIEVTCNPMYSRDEMRKFNVTGWLNQKYVRKAGYL